jgi:hypothetical protein
MIEVLVVGIPVVGINRNGKSIAVVAESIAVVAVDSVSVGVKVDHDPNGKSTALMATAT